MMGSRVWGHLTKIDTGKSPGRFQEENSKIKSRLEVLINFRGCEPSSGALAYQRGVIKKTVL